MRDFPNEILLYLHQFRMLQRQHFLTRKGSDFVNVVANVERRDIPFAGRVQRAEESQFERLFPAYRLRSINDPETTKIFGIVVAQIELIPLRRNNLLPRSESRERGTFLWRVRGYC